MKRYVLWAVLAAVLVAGPVGCGKKEIEELNAKVVQLQKDLAAVTEELAEKSTKAEEAGAKAKQLQATVDAQAAELVKIRTERDRLKRDLAVLKKKRR
jgi:septal ring factor EnvC (AmiA/AmiB activator)